MTEAREFYHDVKIDEIDNFQELKKYACPRYRHTSDWYLNCVDCKSFKNCTAGKQAVKLLEESTRVSVNSAKKEPIPDPKNDVRGYITYIFSQKEPVKVLLESAKDIRPTSVYSRVHMWKKNYPDLEEKFRMIEKVRFLWQKPYNSMKVEDILKKLYPEEGPQHDFGGKYAEYPVVGEPEKKQDDSDTVSLDAFLNEVTKPSSSEVPDIQQDISEPEKTSQKDSRHETVRIYPDRFEIGGAISAERKDPEQLDELLVKLRKKYRGS